MTSLTKTRKASSLRIKDWKKVAQKFNITWEEAKKEY